MASVCLDEPGKRICSSGGLSRAAEAGFLCIAWWSCLRWRFSLHNSRSAGGGFAKYMHVRCTHVRAAAQQRRSMLAVLPTSVPTRRHEPQLKKVRLMLRDLRNRRQGFPNSAVADVSWRLRKGPGDADFTNTSHFTKVWVTHGERTFSSHIGQTRCDPRHAFNTAILREQQ